MCEVKVINSEIPDAEVMLYVDYVRKKYGVCPVSMELKLCGDEVEMKYELPKSIPFERIRRITGYLVGTLDRFNDGKKAEEHDRVKHSV